MTEHAHDVLHGAAVLQFKGGKRMARGMDYDTGSIEWTISEDLTPDTIDIADWTATATPRENPRARALSLLLPEHADRCPREWDLTRA